MNFIPSDSQQLRELCAQLATGSEFPIRIACEPITGSAEQNCFPNVQKQVERMGGRMQVGWHLSEGLPGVLLEAEFHAVWVDKDGGYHDITPRSAGVDEILFLPDNTRTYEGRQVNNVRVPLKDDRVIRDYIENENHMFDALNAGELADFHGEVPINPHLHALLEKRQTLGAEIYEKYFLEE